MRAMRDKIKGGVPSKKEEPEEGEAEDKVKGPRYKVLEGADDVNGLEKIVYKDPEETKKNIDELRKKMGNLVEEQKKAGERWGKQFNEESYRFEREWKTIVDAVKDE